MNPVLKPVILASCLEAVRLLNEHRAAEAILVLHEVHALMDLDRRIEATEAFP